MKKWPKALFPWRSALSIGLVSLFLLSAFTAATHFHFPSGGKIQQECRLCVTGGVRQAPTQTSSVFIPPLIVSVLVVTFFEKLLRFSLWGQPPTRSPPLFA